MLNKKIISIFLIVSVVLTAMVALSLMAVSGVMNSAGGDGAAGYTTYSRHYALITPQDEGEFWDRVYAGALEQGQQADTYVERFGEGLSVSYTTNELVHLAVQAGVDGILVPGSEDAETIDAINEAIDQGIPVVTVLQDSSYSRRQGYVGFSGYDAGREYGSQIELLLPDVERSYSEEDPVRVVVLLDEERSDTMQNLMLLGIRETLTADLGVDYPLTVETEPIDNSRSFSPEESVRDIFLNEEDLPDILVCFSTVQTQCAYQAAVDYNKVGEVQILGYFDSESILNAVSMNIIQATMTLDAGEMGAASVRTLGEYLDTGYTNGYTVIDTSWITPEDAAQMLTDETVTE